MAGDQGRLVFYDLDLEPATVQMPAGCMPGAEQFMGGYPSGQRGLTVNQLAEAFGGSNPSPPTWPPSLTGWKKYQSARSHVEKALIAQSVEHVLGKNGVMGSNPIEGSRCRRQLTILSKENNNVWPSKNTSEPSRT
jgi:hypothetical protein